MSLLHKPYFGFLAGFLFGTVGMFLLSMLSLVFQPVELVTQPLFAFGRWLSEIMITDGSANNAEVAVLILGNGILYGVIGALIQKADRALHVS